MRIFSCLNFWEKAQCFSLRVFGLLSSYLLFPQHFSWYFLRPSTVVTCRFRVRQTPEEGRRTYQPKHCGNNKDEDNSLKTLNDKNQASSQKFKQTPEEGQRTYQPKHCGNNNKDEDNSPKTLNDKKMRIFILMLYLPDEWLSDAPPSINHGLKTPNPICQFCFFS